ncbi:hypothetical protein [Moritella sp. F3]|uniref:hypothetical protein n=1 Tax=Moritella sp. F3 TaxID=2718882 RepID=UPI0018E11577|nr:hypothetical protein [Moritella sp. F3]GIC78162.1 hypothetical protein FMO001_28890 [Moritella sp. F1]GIC81195.1 hypothetical protein FMO003_14760 [Moritella sp. F3]
MLLRRVLQRGRASFSQLFNQFSQRLLSQLDSKKRLWIVQVDEGGLKNQSFIVDEDNFQQPLDWMLNRHYSITDLENVDKMKRAEVVSVQLVNAKHSLIRAK